MAKLVSKTYADALFELAVEKGCEDAWLEDAKALLEILHENEELAKLMNHPQIVKEEKLQIIENIFKGKTADEIVGLMCQLIEKDHFKDMESVFACFVDSVKEYKNIGTAYRSICSLITELISSGFNFMKRFHLLSTVFWIIHWLASAAA